jgi:mevalonate kinase
VGNSNSGSVDSAEALEGAPKADRRTQREKDILANHPIFLALLVVLFSGENSTYRTLVRKMESLNGIMRQIDEISDKMKDLTNKISEFMEEQDPEELEKMAEKIWDMQKQLNELIEKNKDSIGPDLLENLKKFADPSGTLDDVLAKAGTGGIELGRACGG